MKYHHQQTQANLPTKLIILWSVFLLGTLFHTQLALMPLFHGLSVTESHAHSYVSIEGIFWFMLVFFMLPMVAIITILFNQSKQWRQLHLIGTVIYTVLNLMHLVLDVAIVVPLYQVVLMLFLLIIGLLLNLVAYQWTQLTKTSQTLPEYS